jgi:hypothetical protein
MRSTHERGQGALLRERLATAEQLLGEGRDRDGMHWLWAAAAGLESDPRQIEAVLDVAERARSSTKGRIVRTDCGVLITRLETQLRNLGVAGNGSPTAQRPEDVSVEPTSAPVASGGLRAASYYLDERLSLAEGTCRFPANGGGGETFEEGFFVVAIRRRGFRECLFRFADGDRAAARAMLETLNHGAVGTPLRAPL